MKHTFLWYKSKFVPLTAKIDEKTGSRHHCMVHPKSVAERDRFQIRKSRPKTLNKQSRTANKGQA
jgi:hypothetical protein